jgi:hypothetical protein
MKTKLVFLLLFLMIFSAPQQTDAQGLYVRTYDQKVKAFDLTTLQSLSFLDNSLLLKKLSGTSETYNLSTVSALYFNSLYTGSNIITVNGKDKQMTIFPNPGTHYIRISRIPSSTVAVSVISLDGRIRMQTEITSDNPLLQIDELERGMYLLKINNQVIKFIKQ